MDSLLCLTNEWTKVAQSPLARGGGRGGVWIYHTTTYCTRGKSSQIRLALADLAFLRLG